MRLPRTLTIDGQRWTVRLKRLPYDYGLCIHKRREIQIDSALPPAERREVLMHEVLHACLPERWAPRMEERMVRRLSPRLIKVLDENGLW